jgi:excinuclease UvrABC ATPase subunit
VIVIEHNLHVIKNADWIIDMGPEGGSNGGTIMFEGTAKELLRAKQSFTSAYLRD